MKKVDLTKGKVISVISALALPIMGSSLLQFTYNMIDMMWVGRLGSDAVASIGSSSLYINIGNAINSLVVIGTGIKVIIFGIIWILREDKNVVILEKQSDPFSILSQREKEVARLAAKGYTNA